MTVYGSPAVSGATVEMGVQTSGLSTIAGTLVDQRFVECKINPKTRELIEIPIAGYEHPAKREAGIAIEKYLEDAVSITKNIARPTAANGTPSIVTLMEAMGCDVQSMESTTVAVFTDTGQWTLTANKGQQGTASLIGIGTGGTPDYYYPVLPSAYASLTNTVTPSMDLPADSVAGSPWQQMFTMVPGYTQVSNAKLLSFVASDRYMHTANDSKFTFLGCAPKTIADVVFEPHVAPTMQFSITAADISGPADNTIAAQTFQDSSRFAIIDGNSAPLHFTLTDYANPVTANSRAELLKATWKVGIENMIIPSTGSANTLNGIQGYMPKYTGSEITLELMMHKSYWTEIEDAAGQTAKYIAIQQPIVNLRDTAFGLWLPYCYQKNAVVYDASGDFLKVEVTYMPTNSGYESGGGITSAPNSPWFFAISGEHSA